MYKNLGVSAQSPGSMGLGCTMFIALGAAVFCPLPALFLKMQEASLTGELDPPRTPTALSADLIPASIPRGSQGSHKHLQI